MANNKFNKMEFWNSQLTEKSWRLLQEIRKKYNFILIGGWSTYLWTKQQKSKDIDIVVSLTELQKLKQEDLRKNDALKKYEIKSDEIDIDIYLEYYSKLTIPPEDIKKYTSQIEGFNVASQEALLVLKQGAEIDRENSIKGEKDRADIVSLMLFANPDYNAYLKILKEYSKEEYFHRLVKILKDFREYNIVGLSPKEFKSKKEKTLEQLKKVK
ncbi:hypothetical protein J4447_02725 [Candidatus Pacearchaeota archaeon]|nr:hypothetical protein [Candidatus Pacearchaeota archaeon]